MSEYKLLKKYPSLPTDWEEGMIVGLGDRAQLYAPCNGIYTDKRLGNPEVENNPEYWEITAFHYVTADGAVITNEEDLLYDTLDYDKKSAHFSNITFFSQTQAKYAEGITDRKFWKSKQVAEEYMIINIPAISISDIIAMSAVGCANPIEKFKELVEYKLKK